MRRSRVPIADKRVLESRKNPNLTQRKATLSDPKVMRRKSSVSMVNTKSAKEKKTKCGSCKKVMKEGDTGAIGVTSVMDSFLGNVLGSMRMKIRN